MDMKGIFMKKAFTLAEVLITLAIIGIVAALTIPSVISNYQQQEFKTGLKKAVSVLNEAIQTNIAQEGETPYENENLYEYLQRHISILKSGQAFICSSVYQEGVVCSGGGSNNYFYTTIMFNDITDRDWSLYACSALIGFGIMEGLKWLIEKIASKK